MSGWTKTPPSEPGWYWVIQSGAWESQEPIVVRLYTDNWLGRHWEATGHIDYWTDKSFARFWSEPIAMPSPPASINQKPEHVD